MNLYVTWLSRSSINLLLLLSTALPVRAEFKAGSQTLSLGVGGGAVSRSHSTDFGYGYSSTNKGAGTLGLQYFYYLTDKPAFALGLEATGTNTRAYTYGYPFSGVTSGDLSLSSYNLLGKLSFPTGVLRPYLFAGGGVAFSRFSPEGPVTSSFEEHRTGGDAVFGAGADLFITNSFFLGLEYRNDLYFIPGHDSLTERTQPIRSLRQLMLRIGLKFGA